MNKAIISDTSCLIALSKVGLLYILQKIYQEIIITSEVKEEFGETLPDWIKVTKVENIDRLTELEKTLDKGEASSVALALEFENSTLIIDEIKGRKFAAAYNIEIIGTIGILLIAHKKGVVKDVLSIILKLVNKGFRLSDKIIDQLIEKYGKK